MLPTHSYRILVVDDVPDNLFLLQMILEAEGYDVDTADNGSLALVLISAEPPDLVLLDVMMPDINGFEVTLRLRQNDKLPFIPILLITAHEEPWAIEGLDIGANDFIRKPIEVDGLLAISRELCG